MKRIPHRIKAETYINYLEKSELEAHDFSVFYEGVFKKNYSGDILKEEKVYDTGRLVKRNFYLSREGFYDKLPEGMFHPADRSLRLSPFNQNKGSDDSYDQRQKEKEHARKFFFPFENSLFSINLELEDFICSWHKDPIFALQEKIFKDDALSDLDPEYKKRIIRFLPFFPQLKRDINMLKFFLCAIFDANVAIKQKEELATIYDDSQEYKNVLGEATLSDSLVCGDTARDLVVSWHIQLMPKKKELGFYVNNGSVNKIIDIVDRFFIPAGAKTCYQIVSLHYNRLILSHPETADTNQFLGYNIII